MQETENAVETSQLIEVRRRRVGLRHTMTAVEEAASSALAGRATEWRPKLLTQVDDLRVAWESHVSGTEGPGGLWEQIRTDAPRLDGHLRRLRREHVELTTEMGVLHQDLMAAGDDDTLHLSDVRERVVALLVKLARHRQRGADLIYEAYQHDVGGSQ
jgi:hypothetical protein